MEKTQRKQSLNCLSNTPKLFDLKELLSSLKITPGQMGNMKGLIYIEGLTEKQVRQKLSHAKIIGTNRFGINSCLYYIFFEDVKGRYLLFSKDPRTISNAEVFLAYHCILTFRLQCHPQNGSSRSSLSSIYHATCLVIST